MDGFDVLQYHYGENDLDVTSRPRGFKEGSLVSLGSGDYFEMEMSSRESSKLLSVPRGFPLVEPKPFARSHFNPAKPLELPHLMVDHASDGAFNNRLPECTHAREFDTATISQGKPFRRRYAPEKWAEIQTIVQSLYIDRGYPLHETMRILEDEYSFKASYVCPYI